MYDFDYFRDIYGAAVSEINMVDLLLNNVLAGAAFTIVCLVALRYVVRAIFWSWFGKRNGSFLATAVEIATSVIFAIKAYQNPGVIVVLVAWSAAVFRGLVRSL